MSPFVLTQGSLSHGQIAFQISYNPRQFLQGAPIVEAFLLGFDQRFARVAVFVEVFGEATAGAPESKLVTVRAIP